MLLKALPTEKCSAERGEQHSCVSVLQYADLQVGQSFLECVKSRPISSLLAVDNIVYLAERQGVHFLGNGGNEHLQTTF